MENKAIEAVTLGADGVISDFSMWALFLRADWVVQVVILLLLFASFWCWAIVAEKWMLVRRQNRGVNNFEKEFWSGGSLDELYARIGDAPKDPMSSVFSAAMREWKRASEKGARAGSGISLRERIDRVMQITAARELDRMERYMTFLATTGATAPFVGLFGTVWGIMNSFQAIAMSKNTSLAVVAPGIAEALFATALGLLAAIPAVIAFNKFSKELDRFSGRLQGFAIEFSAIISRQMEE